ncbi:MAG: YraN family protein, partial [bacterium]
KEFMGEKTQKQVVGKLGEDLALKFLGQKGYKVVARNFRQKFGELDLVFKDKEEWVFVEVKTRKKIENNAFGYPEQAVNRRKIQKISNTAQKFLEINSCSLDRAKWRIDVIAIYLDWRTRQAEIKHIKNVI